MGDPSPEDWNRAQRYASWMRHVEVDEWRALGEETFNKLRLNSPPGGWFPALQDLSWCITESNLPHADLFFSPHLKRVSLRAASAWNDTGVLQHFIPIMASKISALPTSSLERISGDASHLTMPWELLKDSFSSIVLRCGSSFTEYDTPVPLSKAALDHLIQLPHLRTWRTHGPPPDSSASSWPLVFPPIREFILGECSAPEWLPLLGRLDGASTTQGLTPLSKAKESLKILKIEDLSSINIDASLFTIQCFRNLVDLNVDVNCHDGDDRGDCIFDLDNDDVTKFAMALTQLESLLLGHACFEDICATTVACLLPISVHCKELKKLEIHFNTTDIADDFKNIYEDPRLQQLRSLPRCRLTCLDVYQMPLSLEESDLEIVAKGMIDIFPSLIHFEAVEERCWDELSDKIADLREDSE